MKKIINPWTRREGYDCFGCCPNNPIGVHMTFFEDGDDIVSYWKPSQHYQRLSTRRLDGWCSANCRRAV